MRGKKILRSLLICCVAILGILALRPNEVRASALGNECKPITIEICTICGNDYDNGGVCPHHIGEYYDQRVCTITRICRICGGNYDDGSECPHHEGERYGGETCTPYEGLICNICAHDYNMGEVCPHHVGEMYNGQVCETSSICLCNVCGHDYNNPDVCGHESGKSYLLRGGKPPKDFVISVMFGGCVGFGFGAGAYAGFAIDEEGNVATLKAISYYGEIISGASAAVQLQITNAKSLNDIAGCGVNVGVSGGANSGAEIDWLIGKDWTGVGISYLPMCGLGSFEAHGGGSYTWVKEVDESNEVIQVIRNYIDELYNIINAEQIAYVNNLYGTEIL